MTIPAAKKLISSYLRDHALSYSSLTATTVHPYIRGAVVTVHGWPMIPVDLDLCEFGREHGLVIDFAR